jgi:hypothetical protein
MVLKVSYLVKYLTCVTIFLHLLRSYVIHKKMHDETKLFIINMNVEKQNVQMFYVATFCLMMTVQEPKYVT